MNFLKNRFKMKTKKSITGILYISPFIVGFLLFFLAPFIQSFIFSINKLNLESTGYSLEYIGLQNYEFTLLTHHEFIQIFIETISTMIADVPLIIFFSFFAALLINQKFRGRLLARIIFFLPVILSTGVFLALRRGDFVALVEQSQAGQVPEQTEVLGGNHLEMFMRQLQIPSQITNYIIGGVSRIPEVIRASGIQILIFLAGLNSISSDIYEASRIEGATAWENFWLITFPLMSPIILTNVVYTVIDSFLSSRNELVDLIRQTAFGGAGYGVSSAMGVLYFGAIALILLIVVGLLSRWVFYQE